MTKGNSRVLQKRVYAAPKRRWCGVPCTLLIAAWSLFLLLLLTSSISHDEDQNKGIFPERPWRALFWPQTSRQVLLGPEEDGLPGSQLCFIDGFINFRNSEIVKRENADDGIFPRFAASIFDEQELAEDTQSQRVGPTYGNPSPHYDCSSPSRAAHKEKEGGPLPSDVGIVHPSPAASKSVGQALNALQYAEYGAGLLQKSGPGTVNSKICLVEDAHGAYFRMHSRTGEFTGQKYVRSLGSSGEDESCMHDQERCYDAQSYGRDIVAELEPGFSYLVCQSEMHSGMVLCDLVCSSPSECFFSKVDFKLCHKGCLIGDYLVGVCKAHQNPEQLDTSSRKHMETSPEVADVADAETLSLLDQIDTGQDESPVPPSADEHHDSIRVQWETGVSEETPEGFFAVEVVMPENEVSDLSVELLDEVSQGKLPGSEDLHAPKISVIVDENDMHQPLTSLDTGNATEEYGEVNAESVSSPPVKSDSQEVHKTLSRVNSVASLDEYKRSILEQQKRSGTQLDLSGVETRKMQKSDQSYNYAASSHGAKVLASNKEAKGPSHILVSDKDKYLRNPCGAEDKHVVVELSEETFVDTLVLANFEFHSSNLKDFELLGSPVYPTKEWISLGKFQAENVRHRQTFALDNPRLVRHLMLKMLSHWGSEFYCTLSVIEVFGVDVIKNLLDDWISLEEVDNNARGQGTNGHTTSRNENLTISTGRSETPSDDASVDQIAELSIEKPGSDLTAGANGDEDLKTGTVGDTAQEVLHSTGGKAAGDSVLKILMQRVKALELNQTLFDLYLGDMTLKYRAMLSALDKDLVLVTDRLRNETILTASLAMRLADRDLQRKEEQQQMELRFAQIASNFTDNLDFMRWQIQSMERREISAILLAFLCMILSALLHLLASCVAKRKSSEGASVITKMERLNLSSVCHSTSTCVLYLGSGLTILVLSV